jgi:hypothetical protein
MTKSKKEAKKTATKEIKSEPKKAEAPKKEAPAKDAKISKKSVSMGLLDRKDGASLDEMADAITKSGIDPDTKKNRATSLLYMAPGKLPKPVVRDEGARYHWK